VLLTDRRSHLESHAAGRAEGTIKTVHDLFDRGAGNKGRKTDWRRWRLNLDSMIDSHLASTWREVRDRYDAASSWFARFRLTGWKRGATEVMSEGLTLAAGGLVVVYATAIPAFVEFDEAKINSVKYSVTFLDKTGNPIGKRGILHSDAVPLEQLPDHLIKATLATEDRRFFEHFGIDVFGTARALMTNVNAGETVQGGSTLTQQLAKNLFLTNERSLQRKIKEMYLSFMLESRLSKRDILKLYLDRAYMGGGAFGVEAAAQFYFGKSAREVTLAEAAMLAGLFKAPTKYAPHVNLSNARARANEVLSNLVEAGYMTAGQVHAARMNPARAIDNRNPDSPDWFLDWAFEEAVRIADGRGHSVLTVRTTVDMSLQKAADEAVLSTLRQSGRSATINSGALVAMEPDGAVRAMVGGPDYGESQFNRATMARRQPGSSFKLYVYAAALEEGLSRDMRLPDRAPTCGNWSPKNYDGGSGSGASITLADAFKRSLNTIAVDLSLYRLGPNSRDKVVEMTKRLGVDGISKTCSMALGDGGVSPLANTAAFAHFANQGKAVRPYAIVDMFNSKGEVIYSRDTDEPAPRQVLQRRTVEQMNQMMQLVVTEGTGRRATLDFTHSAGKTGTSSSYRDAWFVGFTGALVTGVWFGNDDNRATNRITGGNLPAETWQRFMAVAHTNMNIPTIAGLTPHPRQLQEQERLAQLKRTDPALAAAQLQAGQRSNKIMPDKTRDVLKRLAETLRRSNGTGDPAAGAGTPGAPPSLRQGDSDPTRRQPAAPAERRADAAGPTAAPGPTTRN
jgi:penicillin-binding protein 1A